MSNAVDGYVQIAPDSSGQKVDTTTITRDDGTVVARQRVSIGDDTVPGEIASVEGGALSVRQDDVINYLSAIAATLDDIHTLLYAALKGK